MERAHPSGLATVRTASGSLESLQEYGHFDAVAAPVAQAIVEARPYLQCDSPDASVEIEGRLGTLGEQGAFNSNVGQQTFCSVLAQLETFPRWKHVTGWVESHDVFYSLSVPAEICGLDKATVMQVRTSVGLDAEKQLVLIHTLKRRLRSVTMQAAALSSGSSALDGQERLQTPLQARVSVSVEQRLPLEILPVAVTPELVRIKQRKRFLLNSLGVEKPAFAIDMTIVYSGRTKSEAEQRQALAAEPSFEVEVECLQPQAYLQSCDQDETVLALSLILKLHDFIAAANPQTAVTLARARTSR